MCNKQVSWNNAFLFFSILSFQGQAFSCDELPVVSFIFLCITLHILCVKRLQQEIVSAFFSPVTHFCVTSQLSPMQLEQCAKKYHLIQCGTHVQQTQCILYLKGQYLCLVPNYKPISYYAESIFSYISSSRQPILENSFALIQLSLMCLFKEKNFVTLSCVHLYSFIVCID